ncbi:MAG: hypothetical protein JNM56_23695 [Planctomycetia bacterium]|nr:hypothetical protein [Planctomycetia bacterium]
MAKKRKKPKPKPKRPPTPAKFPIGTLVRVTAGTSDPNFLDIPIGGWCGIIIEVEEGPGSASYLIEWDRRTLDAMHPVYRNRCERDGLELESMWLDENDIEADTGEAVPIEQPTQIVTRPLRMNDPEDRIRAILGVTSDDPLPEVNEENLRKYHEYLNEKLTFPFPARYEEETGPFQSRQHRLTVTSLHDPDDCDEEEGLLCEALEGDDELEIPLVQIEAASGPNRRLVEDYAYWFVNWPSEGREEAALVHAPGSEVVYDADREMEPSNAWPLFTSFLKTGLMGGFYGTVLGAALASLEGAFVGARTGAILLGVGGGYLGTRTGEMIGVMNRVRQGHWFGGILGVALGALSGGMVGVMLMASLKALLGGLLGGVLGWFLPVKERSFWAINGMIAGAMLGVLAQAWLHAADEAYSGMVTGGIAGAIAGPVLFLTMIVIMVALDAHRS